MTEPPGLDPTTPLFGEHITDARDSDLGTRNAQLRFLMAELGWKRSDCMRLIKAYEADLAAEQERRRVEYLATADNAARRDAGVHSFRDWLALMSYDTGRDHHAPGWARKIRMPRGVEAR